MLNIEPMIQFPALPLRQVNVILQGLAQLPLGQSLDTYSLLHGLTTQQVQQAKEPAPEPPRGSGSD